MLFIGEVVSILYKAGFICFLDSLFSLAFCSISFLSTLCLSCLCQCMTKRGRFIWNVGICENPLCFVQGEFRLFMLGGDIFILLYLFHVSLLIDLYLWCYSLIYVFILCFVKSRIYFVYLYFPHMHLCILFRVLGIYRLIQSCCCLYLQLIDSI